MNTRLTDGNIPLQLTRLAAPLLLGNILQQLYNTIDAFVIGRYAGSLEFAAVGVSAAVMNLFLFVIVGACSGISVVFARHYGAGDTATFRRGHFLTVLFGTAAVCLLSAAGILFLPHLLTLIRTPEELRGFVTAYLRIILSGLPAAFLYNVYSAFLRGVGSTTAALAVLSAGALINLVLDILFVASLDMGVTGAALATVLAQLLSALLAAGYLRNRYPLLMFRRQDCRMDLPLLGETARYACTTALHQSGLYIGKLCVQGTVNTGGTELITAFTATTRIEAFANSFGDSGASATAILTAQNCGARKPERVRETFRKSFVMLLALGLVCSAVMFLSADVTVTLLLGVRSGAAYDSAVSYLRLISLFYVFCFTGNAFAGHFNGVGRVLTTFAGSLGHITLRAVLSWLWLSRFGLDTVAVSAGTGWVLVNLFWAVLYFRRLRQDGSPE